MKAILNILIVTTLIALIKCSLVLKPTKTDGEKAGYVFVQGASIPAINYKKYALQLQDKFNGSLWVGIADFPLNTPEPILVGTVINRLLEEFRKLGFNIRKDTKLFFGGHSLGGIIIQDYLFGLNRDELPYNLAGLVLEGSFVLRSNLQKTKNFPPICTLGGELDGLARITRIAEAFYHNVPSKFENTRLNVGNVNASCTIIIPGMNHYQFAGEGEPPRNVAKNDIEAEITNEEARDAVTSIINIFFKFQLNKYTNDDVNYFTSALKQTSDLAYPIIDGFLMEGFIHFKPPCPSKQNLETSDCFVGSPWSQIAQQMLSNVTEPPLNVTDTFINIISIPEKFPKITATNCPGPNCHVNVLSHTENSYNILDRIDIGLEPIAAYEAKTKMISRQNILQHITNKPFDFNQTDETSLCGQINQAAIDWAQKQILPRTLNRYLNKGKLLRVVDDIPVATGSSWIIDTLKYKQFFDKDANRTIVELASATLRTPTNYIISFVAGLHYCKLLTVARAIEWMYVDCVKP